jgi:hypothetical protein
MILPVTYRTSTFVLSTLLLATLVTACSKEPAPLMSLPPVKELPKAATAAAAQVGNEDLGKEDFVVKGDYGWPEVVGRSGKICAETCKAESTLDTCKAAVTADGCDQIRDEWRAKNPGKRNYAKEGGGRL